MTDKEKIRAEAERLLNKEWKWQSSIEGKYRCETYRELLEFIDSLPEEPVSEELEEAGKKYAIEQVLCTTDTRMTEQAYLSLKIFNGYDVACAYKDGAESHREQMMNDAIDYEIEGEKVKVIIINGD